MTTWYSYYRNFHSPFPHSRPTDFFGGYNINDYLSSDGSMAEDEDAINLQNIESVMLGKAGITDQTWKSALSLYKEFLSNQVGSVEGDERLQMVLNWQQYNKNEIFRQHPEVTALAFAMLYIADGWRILGGRINARKYRKFIRGFLRPLESGNALKVAYTAISKIMHNPMNAGDQVLERIEKRRAENLAERMWGNVYAPRLLRLGLPKMKQSDYYSLDEVAANPELAGQKRQIVKKED